MSQFGLSLSVRELCSTAASRNLLHCCGKSHAMLAANVCSDCRATELCEINIATTGNTRDRLDKWLHGVYNVTYEHRISGIFSYTTRITMYDYIAIYDRWYNSLHLQTPLFIIYIDTLL